MESPHEKSPWHYWQLEYCEKCKQVQTTKGTQELFLKAVTVWINKPHVVNRRLCGSKVVKIFRLHTKENVHETLESIAKNSLTPENISDFTDLVAETCPFTLIVRELIPKSEFFPKILEAVIYDKEKVCVSFVPISQNCDVNNLLQPTHELEYSVQFTQTDPSFPAWAQVNEIFLSWSCDHKEKELLRRQNTSEWLRGTLLEKLVSWSHVNDISTSATSLCLVPVDKYKDTYIRLKNAYGRDLVKNWTERTDPKKFVYEDVAIAAYLLLVWEDDREKKNLTKKQSFVDLGCGNGLLVYILTKEGHKGLGIDLRKRKIWDTFGPDIDLREQAITPSADHLFPDYDWIIGNHSDELTPWIPVIAARSSYDCCFFVLPCCHHDFVGKYGLSEKGKSRYHTYLDYVKEIVTCCGFYTESDTLRIPSTKRICYIGRQKSYAKENEKKIDKQRQAYIDMRIMRSLKKTPTIPAGKSSAPPSRFFTSSKDCKRAQEAEAGNPVNPTDNNLSDANTNSDSLAQMIQNCIDSSAEEVTSNSVGLNSSASSSTEAKSSVTSEFNICDKRKHHDTDLTWTGVSTGTDAVKKIKPDCGGVGTNDSTTDKDLTTEVDFLSEGYGSLGSTGTEESITPSLTNYPSYEDSNFSSMSDTDGVRNQSDGSQNQQWADNFKPRVEQGVRNCQKVPKEIQNRIVSTVFQLVLYAANGKKIELKNGKSWRKGGCVPLGSIASLFDKATLLEMKSECGGLQTLLRNHSHVFQVTGGEIQLRDFTQDDPWKGSNPNKTKGKGGNLDTRKTTLCWFNTHHPDGCPRDKTDCLFAHGEEELREKPNRHDRG